MTLLAQSAIVALHVLVVILAARLALNERISTISRFQHELMAGRFSIVKFVSVEDERKGFRREMIEGLTDTAHFSFLMAHDNRNGLCQYSLQVNDQYYGSWYAREHGQTRLARLFRAIRPQT